MVDIALALILGVVFLPVMAATAAVVFASLGSPVLFRQHRAGAGGREFELLKWRTMSNEKDERGVLLPDDLRITPAGRIIRQLRIDELPSVVNILRGDLSFVGPRPLPSDNTINRELGGARLSVRPGLTGLAQVCGNTLLSGAEKLALDLYYIRTHTLAGDLVIVWRTLMTVVRGERRDEAMIRTAIRTVGKTI